FHRRWFLIVLVLVLASILALVPGIPVRVQYATCAKCCHSFSSHPMPWRRYNTGYLLLTV
ncbi:MAG TPA: hypothetical protein VK956_14460, partial [Verrucomicrobium sp.]|nr:hypothetical protein [Verrucomicrobium sp.]